MTIIKSTSRNANTEVSGNIKSGLSMGADLYVTTFGTDEQLLRNIVGISNVITTAIRLTLFNCI